MTDNELEKIGIFSDNRNVVPFDREDWDQYWLGEAEKVSERSHDSQTKHGTVLVKDNRRLVSGYNGWPPGAPDDIIPNVRPWKYDFVGHSEEAALIHAARKGISVEGATAYITGHPCHNCCRLLICAGIKKWIIGSRGYQASEKDLILRKFWIETFNVEVIKGR